MTEILIGLVIGTQAAIIFWMWCTMRIQKTTIKRLNNHAEWLRLHGDWLELHGRSFRNLSNRIEDSKRGLNKPKDDADWWKGEQE